MLCVKMMTRKSMLNMYLVAMVVLVSVFTSYCSAAVTPQDVCSIPNCDTDACTANDCHRCHDGYRLLGLYVWPYCDPHCKLCVDDNYFKCSGNCKTCALETCNSTGCYTPGLFKCPVCPASYYLGHHKHCYPCGETGCECSVEGSCVGCMPGKYDTSNFCIDDCPTGCTVCSDKTTCSSCVPGKYGVVCDKVCIDTCSDGTCNKDSGRCDTGSKDDCPPGCTVCSDRTACSSCVPGKYGVVCDKVCNGTCSDGTCNKDSGRCGTGSRDDCPPGCTVCSDRTTCSSCVPGKYGVVCDKVCIDTCSDGTCNKNSGRCDTGISASTRDIVVIGVPVTVGILGAIFITVFVLFIIKKRRGSLCSPRELPKVTEAGARQATEGTDCRPTKDSDNYVVPTRSPGDSEYTSVSETTTKDSDNYVVPTWSPDDPEYTSLSEPSGYEIPITHQR